MVKYALEGPSLGKYALFPSSPGRVRFVSLEEATFFNDSRHAIATVLFNEKNRTDYGHVGDLTLVQVKEEVITAVNSVVVERF